MGLMYLRFNWKHLYSHNLRSMCQQTRVIVLLFIIPFSAFRFPPGSSDHQQFYPPTFEV